MKSMSGFGGGVASLSMAGGAGATPTDLASFFGVSPSSYTTVRIRPLDNRYACTYTEPANGWQDLPKTSGITGTFLSYFGTVTVDNVGCWKNGGSGIYAMPTANAPTTISGHAALTNFYPEGSTSDQYDVTKINNTSTTNGMFIDGSYKLYANTSGNDCYIDADFSSGLGSGTLGFTMQSYGSYQGNLGYHNNPLYRMTCNGISATFAPKGPFVYNSDTTAAFGSNGNHPHEGGFVCYPTIYDDTTQTQIDSHFANLTGTSLPSNYFVY